MSKRTGIGLILISIIILAGYLLLSHQTTPLSPEPMSSPSTITPTHSASTKKGGTLPFVLSVPPGYQIGLFAEDVPNARDIQLTKNGTLLVSSPATGSVYALKDNNNDGIADEKKVIISGLNHPHGLALFQGKLFVAEVDQVDRYSWDENAISAEKDKVLFSLPQNANHNNRTLLFDAKGNLFISVGSTCNVCNESDSRNGTIMVSDSEGKNPRIYAKGLRNAPFMTLMPGTDTLIATGMGRDYLGDNLPPDEVDEIQEGKDYGWPICYGNKVHDTNFDKKQYITDPCRTTIPPIYEVPAHSAPLGLEFTPSNFSAEWNGDLLVAYHGSWNRSTKIGYKVVRLNVNGNTISGEEDFITGFLQDGNVLGRPVDVTFDRNGNLYVSDDQTGNIYIVTPK